MILPPIQSREFQALVRNLVRECSVTREARRATNRLLRTFYLEGTDRNEEVKRNKLAEFVETSSAYCYAPEGIKLGVTLPRSYGDTWIEEEDAARDEIGRVFLDSGTDMAYGLMVEWAHVYPSMFGKVLISDQEVTMVPVQDPSDIGAWEENKPTLDDQEAFTHHFEMNVAAATRMVRQAVFSQQDADEIVAEIESAKSRGTRQSLLGPATPKVLLAQALPNMIGAVQHMNAPETAIPQVQADVIEVAELWMRDDLALPICKCRRREHDDIHDRSFALFDHKFEPSGEHEWEWRKTLHIPATERVLWSTLNPLLRQRQPIRQLSLWPSLNYLWGQSIMKRLLVMQLWGEQLIGKHDELLDQQLNPAIALIGMSNVDGERAKLLRTAGGTFSMPIGSSVQRLAPETPPDAAGMTQLINQWFAEAGGLPRGSSGPDEANVRSAGQMTAGAMLSAPRTNRRAMRCEDTLEEILTDELRLHRRILKEPLRIPLNEPDAEKDPPSHAKWQDQPYRQFFLSQMPGDLLVRVSSHSASPLFANQAKEDALLLKREGAIDAETFVEMVNPPMAEMVRAKARRIAASAAKKQSRLLEAKEQEAASKKASADAKIEAARSK